MHMLQEIVVRDSGIGIDSKLLPHVFELFTQAERSIDRSQGGLGIGLTVVKSMIELHGGTVSARSKGKGKGSEFRIRLPVRGHRLRESPPCRGSAAPGLHACVHVKHLLLVSSVAPGYSGTPAFDLD